MLVACLWSRDAALGTTRFTQELCARHSIPRFSGTSTLLVDVVSSSGRPRAVGALLLLSAYLLCCRSRALQYLCTIAVTRKGRALCEQLGMHSHAYREGGAQRVLFWCKGGELDASAINARLRLNRAVYERCWRAGLTPRTEGRRYPRC